MKCQRCEGHGVIERSAVGGGPFPLCPVCKGSGEEIARAVTVNKLPDGVRLLVQVGWYAVVYKGVQVLGIFPQRVLADGYIGAVAEREDRPLYQVVGRDSDKK